jgi:hypothetical protein
MGSKDVLGGEILSASMDVGPNVPTFVDSIGGGELTMTATG